MLDKCNYIGKTVINLWLNFVEWLEVKINVFRRYHNFFLGTLQPSYSTDLTLIFVILYSKYWQNRNPTHRNAAEIRILARSSSHSSGNFLLSKSRGKIDMKTCRMTFSLTDQVVFQYLPRLPAEFQISACMWHVDLVTEDAWRRWYPKTRPSLSLRFTLLCSTSSPFDPCLRYKIQFNWLLFRVHVIRK